MDDNQAGFLAGKSFCFLTAQPGLKWIIDSGATDHITPHLYLFHIYYVVLRPCFITMLMGNKFRLSILEQLLSILVLVWKKSSMPRIFSSTFFLPINWPSNFLLM